MVLIRLTWIRRPCIKPIPANSNWQFLTGNKDQLYKMARQAYGIDNGKPDTTLPVKTSSSINCSSPWWIKWGVCGYGLPDGLDNSEVDKLIDDIKGLLKER